MVAAGRVLLPQSFAGTTLVRCSVALPESIQANLLGRQVLCRRLPEGTLEGPVHALMATVLLELARFDALGNDIQAYSPDEEEGKTTNAGDGKGDAVVGTQAL